MQGRSDEWGYKIPFAIQWIWPFPIIIGVALAPESPWWLIRKERPEEARKALLRLTVPEKDPNFNIDDTIAMIRSTNDMEKKISTGSSYMDCFRGVDLRRTEIVCLTWVTQALCGSTLMGYSTYFFQQAGLATSNAFTMSMVQYMLGVIGTLLSWPMMTKFGRRTLYISGLASMGAVLFIIGCLGIISKGSEPAQWGVGALLLVYTLIYDLTVGPICYSLVAELSSTRLRSKTIVLARNCFTISGLVTNTLIPRMLNPSAWNWGAKIGYFWAGSCLLCFLWAFFRLPEPKGRTYAELDLLFEQGVPARRFSATFVDPFGESHEGNIDEKGAEDTVVEKIERI
jgi:SP family general alpha glucoside:H+ symporter-like MFS transporter